jgi:hypothetical protein
MKKKTFIIFILALWGACLWAGNISFMHREGSSNVQMGGKKWVKKEKSLWMIVKPQQYRYLFVLRSFYDPETKKIKYDNPAIWSKYAGAWPNNGGYLDLKYVKAGKEHDFFHNNKPTYVVMKENGPLAKFRIDYSSPDLSCALIYSYKEKDKKFILQILFDPHVEIDKYILTFSCQTSDNRQDKKKLLIVGDKKLPVGNTFVKLDPRMDCRFIYTSEESATNKPFALVSMLGQAVSCEAKVTKWSFHTKFVYPGNAQKATFLFYDKWDDYKKGMDYLENIKVSIK